MSDICKYYIKNKLTLKKIDENKKKVIKKLSKNVFNKNI